eukprot:1059889-Pyramimonas_sp.AAC.1
MYGVDTVMCGVDTIMRGVDIVMCGRRFIRKKVVSVARQSLALSKTLVTHLVETLVTHLFDNFGHSPC